MRARMSSSRVSGTTIRRPLNAPLIVTPESKMGTGSLSVSQDATSPRVVAWHCGKMAVSLTTLDAAGADRNGGWQLTMGGVLRITDKEPSNRFSVAVAVAIFGAAFMVLAWPWLSGAVKIGRASCRE